MDAKDVGTAVFQIIAALGILAGVVVSVTTLSRGERIRRRLKTNAEILAALGEESREACLMQELVTQDTDLLYALTFPTPRSELQKWSRYERLGGFVALVLSAGSIFGVADNDRASSILAAFITLTFFFLAVTTQRQMAAEKVIKHRQQS